MSFFPQKKLFVMWGAVTGTDHGADPELIAAHLIPALIKLKEVGYRIAVVAVPTSREASCVLHLLANQGAGFDEVMQDSVAPLGNEPMVNKAVGSRGGMSWNPELFALVREDLWAHRLDRQRTYVIGPSDEGRGLAELLGITYQAITAERTWADAARELLQVKRVGRAERCTRETDIRVAVDLGGDPSKSQIATGIGYFDHMLDQLARHGGMELAVSVKGDLVIDDHHSVEDTGLALGEALRQALGDIRGVARYGFTLPMDESLASCALDLSGRPCLVFKGSFSREKVGELATEMVPHFFQSLSQTLRATIHISVEGQNAHHQVEGVFKAVAKSFRAAIQATGESGVPSTKGTL